jgi:hypothetical protein
MRVIIESPYKGNVVRNTAYAKKCLADSLKRGESPIVFHLLYTLVLDDNIESERNKGLVTSFEWHKFAELLAVYKDYGISYGMELAINLARNNNILIDERSLSDTFP